MLDTQANSRELRDVLRARVARGRGDDRRSDRGGRDRRRLRLRAPPRAPEGARGLGRAPVVLFGLGALTYARHPEGIFEAQKRMVVGGIQRLLDRRHARRQAAPGRRRGPGARRPRRARPAAEGTRAVVTLLRARGISKRFAGIAALDDVSLTVGPGEAVGPHRSERCREDDAVQLPARDAARPTPAGCEFDGADITHVPTYRRARLGLGRTFQRVELFGGMTVRDHLLVAERSRLGTGRLWKDFLNRSQPTADELGARGRDAGAARASPTSPTGPSSRSASDGPAWSSSGGR